MSQGNHPLPDWRIVKEPLLFALAWAVVSSASILLRDVFEVTLLMWLPAGVAVAAFHVAAFRRWPLQAAFMLPPHVAMLVLTGVPVGAAVGYSAGSLLQSMIAAWLARRVLGGAGRRMRSFPDVLGVFGGTALACLIGAALALPFRSDPSLVQFLWWFFGNLSGIMTITPLTMQGRNLLIRSGAAAGMPPARELAFAIALFAATSWLVLSAQTLALAPVLIAGLVYVTFRYGYQSSALAVFTFAVVATYMSAGGASPAPASGLAQEEAVLAMQVWLILMLATALPIAAAMMQRDELQFELIRRNSHMHENLMLLDLSEELAGLGRWRVDLVTGEQDWSPRMLELNGLPAGSAPDSGNIRHLLPDGGRKFLRQLSLHRREREPFEFDYTVTPRGEPERVLRISVLNEFDYTGRRIALFGVAMDVTEEARRLEALDKARGRAMELANEAQTLANTDPLTSLPNRRSTFRRLDSMVEVARMHGTPLSAVIFDIDHFKAINDRYGHQTGDEVIVQVAELARRQARGGDLVGRIGGEEFVWLLPGIDERGSRRLAERLRASIERGFAQGAIPDVTVSVGLAAYRAGDDGDALLARADAALYEAKEGGRNQVRRAA